MLQYSDKCEMQHNICVAPAGQQMSIFYWGIGELSGTKQLWFSLSVSIEVKFTEMFKENAFERFN